MKRMAKRVMSMLLVLVMVIGMLPGTAFATGITLTLAVGDEYVITDYSGSRDHNWSSEDTSVAAVTWGRQAATVTAVGPGTTEIVHTYRNSRNGQTYTERWTIVVTGDAGSSGEGTEENLIEIYLYYNLDGTVPSSSGMVDPTGGDAQNYGPAGDNTPMAVITVDKGALIAKANDGELIYQSPAGISNSNWYFIPNSDSAEDIEIFWQAVLACATDLTAFEETGLADSFTGYVLKDVTSDSGKVHLDGVLDVVPPVYVIELYDNGAYFGGAVTDSQAATAKTWNDVLADYARHLGFTVAWTENGDGSHTGIYRSGNNQYSVTVWQKISGSYMLSDIGGDIGYAEKNPQYYLAAFDMTGPVDQGPVLFTITYTDGVEGEEVFADQVYTLELGAETAFNGTPTRANYTFEGWMDENGNTYDPEETLPVVTGDMVYTARWELIPGALIVTKTFSGLSAGSLPAGFSIVVTGTGYSETLNFNNADEISGDGLTYTWVLNDLVPGQYSVIENGASVDGYTLQASSVVSAMPVVSSGAETTARLSNVYQINLYTVTWVNHDGEELETDENVAYGTDPEYNGSTPARPDDEDGTAYIFVGWSPVLSPVKGDVTYTAQFAKKYTVTYTDGVDGREVFADQVYPVAEGSDTPAFEGDPDVRPGYVFAGWDPAVVDTVTETVIYTAAWTAANDTQYRVEHYLMNADGTYPDTAADVDTLSGTTDASVTAQYKTTYTGYAAHGDAPGTVASGIIAADGSLVLKLYYTRVYTVTWLEHDSTAHTEENVPHGTLVSTLTPPAVGGYEDGDYTYTFTGWEQIIPVVGEGGQEAGTVAADLTYRATYSAKAKDRTGTVNVYLDAVKTDSGVTGLEAITTMLGEKGKVYVKSASGGDYIELTMGEEGVYTAALAVGTYEIFVSDGTGYALVSPQKLVVGVGLPNSADVYFNSVTYDLTGGNIGGDTANVVEYYLTGNKVDVITAAPQKTDYIFIQWNTREDGSGDTYLASTVLEKQLLTDRITAPYYLYARWDDTMDVKVVVNITHNGDDRRNVDGELLHIDLTRKDSDGNYIEVVGSYARETAPYAEWHSASKDGVSTVTRTFENLPYVEGLEKEYSANAALDGYKYSETSPVTIAVVEGVYTVTIDLVYDPIGFELKFDVVFIHGDSDLDTDALCAVSDQYVPATVDVVVTYWDEAAGKWLPISEHAATAEAVTLIREGDTYKWVGSDTVHVWGFDGSDPYRYRVEVVGVDLDGYYAKLSGTDYINYGNGVSPSQLLPQNAYTATVAVMGNTTDSSVGVQAAGTGDSLTQSGDITVTVRIHPYTLLLDDNDGDTTDAADVFDLGDRFLVPDLSGYVPTREGYTFGGWYYDQACTKPAAQSDYLYKQTGAPAGSTVTLYALWKENLTVRGTVTIDTFYMLNGSKHYINQTDLPTEVVVELMAYDPDSGEGVVVDTYTVSSIVYGGESGAGSYIFTDIPNDGKDYRIRVESRNYDVTYHNQPDTDYSETAYQALFGDEGSAEVNVWLTFDPVSAELIYYVDASAIGAGFRDVGIVVQYDDHSGKVAANWPIIVQQQQGDEVTSRHPVYNDQGKALEEKVSVWLYHPAGHAYSYAVKLYDFSAMVNGERLTNEVYAAADAPFEVTYDLPNTTWWTGSAWGKTLGVILTPKTYSINYALNASSDTVTGMDNAPERHTWSFATGIDVTPVREGYNFLGWTSSVSGAYADGKIAADTATDITLIANWEKQRKVTFLVENGTWTDGFAEPIVCYVTLTNGQADITDLIPAGMKADEGYHNGAWDDAALLDGEVIVSGDGDVTYTYTFARIYVNVTYNVDDPDSNGLMDKEPDDTLPYGESIRVVPNGGIWVHGGETYTGAVNLPLKADAALADPTREGYIFTGWERSDGTGTSEDGTRIVHVYIAQWKSDENQNDIPDIYEKTVTFRVKNGVWNDGTAADRVHTVTLLDENGLWSNSGAADISGLIPTGMTPNEGYLTEPAPFWDPVLPEGGIVSGTAPETFVYEFYTTVTESGGDVPVLPGQYILVDPNGGKWNGSEEKTYVRIDGPYTLQPDPTRTDYVFDGWDCEVDGVSTYAGGVVAYVFTAKWVHISTLNYPATVTVRLDNVPTDLTDLHSGADGLYIKKDGGDSYIAMEKTGTGVYSAEVLMGTYYVYRLEGEQYHQLGKYQLNVTVNGGSLAVDHYSVTYDPNGGAIDGSTGSVKEIYGKGAVVQAADYLPVLDGYDFDGWWYDADGDSVEDANELYEKGDYLTDPVSGIAQPLKLAARWKVAVRATVDVNVTIHHHLNPGATGAIGINPQKEEGELDLNLTYRHYGVNEDYVEQGKTYTDGSWYANGTTTEGTSTWDGISYDTLTTRLSYQNTVTGFNDLSVDWEYSSNVLLDHYVLIDRKVTSATDSIGNVTYTVDVVMQYWPDLFKLDYTVIVDDSIPDELIPVAVDLKVISWDANIDGAWAPINRHIDSSVDVHFDEYVDAGDTAFRKGGGSYSLPVYRVELDEDGNAIVANGIVPYYYRVSVVGFTLPDGTGLTASSSDGVNFWSDTNVVRSNGVTAYVIPLNYADQAYYAVVELTGGQTIAGTDLPGAYGVPNGADSGGSTVYAQQGSITVTVYMNAYDIAFDANGGTLTVGETTYPVDGMDYALTNQFRVPELGGYVPTREGGYVFDGWYLADENGEMTADQVKPGDVLTEDITLVAKWKEPQTITGTITVEGAYMQDGQLLEVHDVDRAARVKVVLQVKEGGEVNDLYTVYEAVTWPAIGDGTASYRFAGLPVLPDGSSYQILVEVLNYTAAYQNEATVGGFNADDNVAVFIADPTATFVNADLTCDPQSYDQLVKVDATAIGEGFRPGNVQTVITYGEQGSGNAFAVISQHCVPPYGMSIALTDGVGQGSQSVWNWHWAGELYDYQAKLTQVDGTAYQNGDPRFAVTYGEVSCWTVNAVPDPLTVTLTPRTYDVIFDMNAAGMADVTRADAHTWSFDTAIDYKPTRTGYVFMGWYADPACTGAPVAEIDAAVCRDTTLYACWAEDILEETPDPTKVGDGIPDIYQCVVTFRIENGTWGENGGSIPIDQVYTLKTDEDGDGVWTDCHPTLDARLPGNMKPDASHSESEGGWTPNGPDGKAVTQATPVVGDAVYTYVYHTANEYLLTIIVENGTAGFGGENYTNTSVTLIVSHDDEESSQVIFAPARDHILRSVTVDGAAMSREQLESFTGLVSVDQKGDHTIHVVYTADTNHNTVPDDCEKKVSFVVVNGTWNDQNGAARLEYFVPLLKDGMPSPDGTADIEDLIPTATAGRGYKEATGAWDAEPDKVVSGTDEVTYTYRYEAPRYVNYPYTILHYKQQPNGEYAHADTGSGTIRIELNVTGDGFEPGQVPTVTLSAGDYLSLGGHYSLDTEHEGYLVSGTPEYGKDLVLYVYYKLDKHTLEYDLNEGASGEDYSKIEQLCGNRVTVKGAPRRDKHIFTGWLAVDADDTDVEYGTYQPGDTFILEDDLKLIAQWERPNDLSYTVYHWEKGTDNLLHSETVGGQAYCEVITASDLKKSFDGFDYDGAHPESLTIGLDVEQNVINLYYVRKDYHYSVEYYYDGKLEDVVSSGIKLPFGSVVDSYPVPDSTVKGKTNYALEDVTGLPLTITHDEDQNVIRVYYVTDMKGDPGDGIPDKYQKEITFKVVNGTWDGENDDDIVIVVTLLDDQGNWSEDGTADISDQIPTGMVADDNCTGGAWRGKTPPNVVKGTDPVTYTYAFTYVSPVVPPADPTPEKGSVVLVKVDGADADTRLSGVVFELYRSSGTLVGTYTTDSNGLIQVDGLESGSYYWQEIRPKEGYRIDYTKRYFTISGSQGIRLTVTNTRSDVPEVFSGDHYAYIIGFDDGRVHPMDNITRAEVATIFFRLLDEGTRSRYLTKVNSFGDVPSNAWYCSAVSTMAAMGIVNGMPDGSFYPAQAITRAEFAAIAARFEEHGNTTNASFSDIYGHWAQKEINIAANNGWVLGYEDGTFKPNQLISRAEAMAMVNRVLQRIPGGKDDLLPNMITWPDNRNENTWYYLTIQEATNSHTYHRKESGYEYWLELRQVPDWKAYER